MRTVIRNSFARHSILAERVRVGGQSCAWCGSIRGTSKPGPASDPTPRVAKPWLYRFHVDDDQGARGSGPIAGGNLFCSRQCCETYTGQPFDETRS